MSDDTEPYVAALHELVSLRAEYTALNGGGPGWTKRWEAAWAVAADLLEED